MITLTCGEPYPLPVPDYDPALRHAIPLFLIRPGNYLQLIIPGMTEQEETAISAGTIKAGIMYEAGAMLMVFRFHDAAGYQLMVFECPFDIKAWPADNRRLPDSDDSDQRLPVQIHALDENKTLRALRDVAMPPDMALTFLLCVQDQMAAFANPELVKTWLEAEPGMRQYQAWTLETGPET
jgi:hypothetical protein